jgi:hypothetical protein
MTEYAASEKACASYGDVSAPSTCVANTNCPAGSSSCGIPPFMQPFATDNAAAAAVGADSTSGLAGATGGFSAAMDYQPLMVGYWSCNSPSMLEGNTTSNDAEKGALSKLKTLFSASKTDMAKIGGQARCPTCRCFESSLVEYVKTSSLKFPIYGQCYRANCYRLDYLQIAVRGQISRKTNWYKCPATGGKISIPGYGGSFHCPDAIEFCSNENISGIKYPEVRHHRTHRVTLS